MPDLTFKVERAKTVPFAATPILAFELAVTNAPENESIHSIVLQCQTRIDPRARSYGDGEKERLHDLFGAPELWSRSLVSLLWAQTTVLVPPFSGTTVVDLTLPCPHDFDAAAAKYFYALEGGVVPLVLLFSGTVFHAGDDGSLVVARVPWTAEAKFALPVRVYKETIDHYHPNLQMLSIRRDVFDRLYRHKRRTGAATWEKALESLLPAEEPLP